jgi:hypothetical protein
LWEKCTTHLEHRLRMFNQECSLKSNTWDISVAMAQLLLFPPCSVSLHLVYMHCYRGAYRWDCSELCTGHTPQLQEDALHARGGETDMNVLATLHCQASSRWMILAMSQLKCMQCMIDSMLDAIEWRGAILWPWRTLWAIPLAMNRMLCMTTPVRGTVLLWNFSMSSRILNALCSYSLHPKL